MRWTTALEILRVYLSTIVIYLNLNNNNISEGKNQQTRVIDEPCNTDFEILIWFAEWRPTRNMGTAKLNISYNSFSFKYNICLILKVL